MAKGGRRVLQVCPPNNASKMDSISVISTLYEDLNYAPPKGCFTIMASVYLSEPSSGRTQVISMGTGSKCLPTNRFSTNGDTVHDFHAEIVARRGAVRWLLLEMTKGHNSEWLEQEGEAWILRNGFSMGMFVSELPCKY